MLYVALTRACEGLVIAGWEKSRGVRTLDGSDYAAVKSALGTLADVVETDDGHMQLYTAATRIAEPSEPTEPPYCQTKKRLRLIHLIWTGLTSLPGAMPGWQAPAAISTGP